MINELYESLNGIIQQTAVNIPVLIKLWAILWGTYFINNYLLGKRLLYLGIFPRHIRGLPGIFFAPLLHADFNHLFFNTIPFLVLSDFLLIYGQLYYFAITLIITLSSGLMIWCFSRPGLHIGASALITGYWAILVLNIYQQGTVTAIILGIICLYYFAGIFLGIFPQEKGVSWEGHLFGLLGGALATYLLPFS